MDDDVSPPGFLKVLASGSGGNCSVLLPQGDRSGRFWLIDAGLSPRRTRALLHAASLSMDQCAGVLLTHLDSDHWNLGWRVGMPDHVRVLLHVRHAEGARRAGLVRDDAETIDEPFDLCEGVRVSPTIAAHDEMGSATYRIQFSGPAGSATMGFATDVGSVDGRFVEHFRRVDVLAIESNYCPRMQRDSRRPFFLKERIMGGRGHLSNQECAAAVAAINPRSHVVLLHLSRQCNHPDLARTEHSDSEYTLTISSQHRATAWIPIANRSAPAGAVPVVHSPLFTDGSCC